jgi:SAM-dependent methyltransferase
MKCRLCGAALSTMFLDLGAAPPSNAFLSEEKLAQPEVYLPLKLFVCRECWLVQLPAHLSAAQTFTPEYVYFSSYSSSWVEHARRFVERAIDRLNLTPASFVVEVASNDGYLLQHVLAHGIPCLGVEPTSGTAAAARSKGIDTIETFFGADAAARLASGRRADLIIANNVLAHVPDLHDFVEGLRIALAPRGTVSIEFPHLLRLVEGVQFDTVYHEHYSYFSLHTAQAALAAHGLRVWDVEELPTHGGSLRIWAIHADDPRPTLPAVDDLLARERSAGLCRVSYYDGFQARVDVVRDDFLRFLLDARRDRRSVAGYGAAAKGNTLLNYCGVKPSLLPYVVDANPAKRGHYLPGSRIPVAAKERLGVDRPDYVVVLPWNLQQEIENELREVRGWGARFVYVVPSLHTT